MADFFNLILIQPVTNIFAIFYFLTGQSFIFGIVLITVLIKVLVYPLYKKQLESAHRLKEAQPRIEKLREKYKDNPVKLQQETVALYKEIKYNPMGCLTSLIIQLPIVITLYSVIRKISNGEGMVLYPFIMSLFKLSGDVTVKLSEFGIDFAKTASNVTKDFGFWAMESLPYILGIVLVVLIQFASSYVSTISSSKRTDEEKRNQKKKKDAEPDPMAQMNSPTFLLINSGFMAVIFGNVAWTMPLGLSVYWIVQSAVSIAQQLIVNAELSKRRQDKLPQKSPKKKN
ncbi:YidC/Oxa1 family membrane protein insertase [Candidatus Dojkabacteria bacterium]|nr:YidC/Oxa1 family membrane protein insertase [Candidatus Dojkabacteria bacterium]